MWERLKSTYVIYSILFVVIVGQGIMLAQKRQIINKKSEEIVRLEKVHSEELDYARNQRRSTVTTITKPDGEITKIIEKVVDRTKVATKSAEKEIVSSKQSTSTSVSSATPSTWSLSLGFQPSSSGASLKELEVGYRLFGPVHGSISVDTDKRILMGLRYEW